MIIRARAPGDRPYYALPVLADRVGTTIGSRDERCGPAAAEDA